MKCMDHEFPGARPIFPASVFEHSHFFHPVDKHKYCVVSSLPCFQFQRVIFWKLSIIQNGPWVCLPINTWYYDLWLPHWVRSQRTLLLLILCYFYVTIELRINQSVKLHLHDTEEPATAPAFRGMKAFVVLGPLSLSLQMHLGAQQCLQWHSCTGSSLGTTSMQVALWLVCNWNMLFKLKRSVLRKSRFARK